MSDSRQKICIASVNPKIGSGYGVGTRTLTNTLLDMGYDVCIYAVFGNNEFVDTYQYNDHTVNIYPIRIDGSDRLAGLDIVYLKENFDILWTFFDLFAFRSNAKDYPVVGWLMLDSEPFLISNYLPMRMYDVLLPVTKYAETMINELKGEKYFGDDIIRNSQVVSYVPLMIDEEYYITNQEEEKKRVENYFKTKIKGRLFSCVAANVEDGGTERKNFPELLLWWKEWTLANPDDYLYLHTEITGRKGMRIPAYLKNIDCDASRIMYSNPLLYESGQYDFDYMRMIYNATDYMIVPSHSEGAGMPYFESAACGAHPIGNNFGSGAEIISNCNGTLIDCVDSYFIHNSKKSKSYAKDINNAVLNAIDSDNKTPNHREDRSNAAYNHYSVSVNHEKIEETIKTAMSNFKTQVKPDLSKERECLFAWKNDKKSK